MNRTDLMKHVNREMAGFLRRTYTDDNGLLPPGMVLTRLWVSADEPQFFMEVKGANPGLRTIVSFRVSAETFNMVDAQTGANHMVVTPVLAPSVPSMVYWSRPHLNELGEQCTGVAGADNMCLEHGCAYTGDGQEA